MNDTTPIPILLHCPLCQARHVDAGEFATRPHHTHACQSCGHVWRPAIVPTVGVQFLPGFKDAVPAAIVVGTDWMPLDQDAPVGSMFEPDLERLRRDVREGGES